MFDKINIRMNPPIDSVNRTSVLNVPNILKTLIINCLKGFIQERMSSEELAARFTINQISTTNLKYMGPVSRANMLAKITLPETRKKAINMFMKIGDYHAIESKDLFHLLVNNPNKIDYLNELINITRRSELKTLLPINPNKEQAQAFMAIINKIYDTGYFNRGSFSVTTVVKNPMQARALIAASRSKYDTVRSELAEKAKLTDDNLANLDDTNLQNFIKKIGCIPFFTEYKNDNKFWGSILKRLDNVFIGNLISDNRNAFANESTYQLLWRFIAVMQSQSLINIDTLLTDQLTDDADMEVYETCAVILNALKDPTKGLANISEKQKNKLYRVSLRMKLFRLTRSLDGYRPESTTSIMQDVQSVAQSISWIANSLGSLLSTDHPNEIDQPHDSDYYSSQGMMLAV